MNSAAKGRRQEHRSIAVLEAAGYECLRSAASKTIWDIAAFSSTDTLLVQVRSSRWPSPAEREAMVLFPAAPGVRKLMHRWQPRAILPEVKEL